METLLPVGTNNQSYSPQLKTVLKTYQLSAVKSLQGPSSALLGMECKSLRQEQQPFHFPSLAAAAAAVSANARATGCGIDNCAERGILVKDIVKKIDENSIDLPILTTKTTARSKEQQLVSPVDSDDDPQPEKFKSIGRCEKRELEFQIPILTAPDQSCSERCETVLENERISCFVVGGERRLCLPQILNTVLQDFSLQQINQVCDELQIYCSRCNHDQLEELKHSGILPRNAPSCGLITQTDAERLVSALLRRAETLESRMLSQDCDDNDTVALEKAKNKRESGGEDSLGRLRVYHECFGKCRGIFDADSFVSEDSTCIECLECGCQFSPQRFVRHAHRPLENRTCHWGFDSTNWRSYLLLSRDQQHYNKCVALFRSLKERYPVASLKRKSELRHESSEKLTKRTKKDIGRDECTGVYNGNGLGMYHPVTSGGGANDPYLQMQWAVFELAARGASAFRPWNAAGSCKHRDSSPLVPAYLSRGPPVLQHPERVVPMSECERFEPHFQPNVALAPIPAPSVVSGPPQQPPPPTTAPQPPPPSQPTVLSNSHSRRLNNHERRRNNHCSTSPNLEKIDTHGISVKLEKPSTPIPETIDDVYTPLLVCATADEHQSQHDEASENLHDRVKQRVIEEPNERQKHEDTHEDDKARVEKDEDEEMKNNEEEDSSAAVTSSTVTMEPPPVEVGTSSHDSDSDAESINSAATELEERLVALDIPQDILTIARRVFNDNKRLRIRHRANLREITRLRDQLALQKIQTFDVSNVRNNVANPSAADSTEMSEDTDITLQTINKDIDPSLASVSND